MRAILIVLAAGVIVIPLIFVSGGADVFRLPKELIFRGEAIVLLALLIPRMRIRRPEPMQMVAGSIVLWTMIVTATSTNRALSIDSMITVIAAAVIFMATCVAAEKISFEAIDVIMIGCCANSVVILLQELTGWSPTPGFPGHYGSVGLLGNPNDVGTFLVAPAVAAMVMVVTATGKRRAIYVAIAALLFAGLAASATRAALIAFVAAMLVLAVMQGRRAALMIGAVLLAIGLVVLSPTTIGRSGRALVESAKNRDYQSLFSERLPPFLTAVDMARDHPFTGVGPGCFKYHFMEYRVALDAKYPAEWLRGFPMNWGEVHNDHLQVLAEAGVIGYLLFLAAIGLLARRSASSGGAARQGFARMLRWPLATTIFVVCLAQFPLELAAPRLIFLTLGALCITWDRTDARTNARTNATT